MMIIIGKSLNSPNRAIDGTLPRNTIQVLSGFENNGDEEVLHIPQISKTEVSLPDAI